MQLTVRFAETTADRDAVFRLRAAVFNDELGRGHPVDADGRVIDAVDGTARLLLAEQDGVAVGTMRINWGGDGPFAPGDHAVYGLDHLQEVVAPDRILIFSRFTTAPSFRGGGLPGQLVDAMARFALSRGVCVVLCDCRPGLVNTYLRLGMRPLRAAVTTPASGLLVPMAMLLDDLSHMEASGSRIAPLLRGTVPDPARRAALLRLLPADPVVEVLDRPEDAPRWTGIVDVLTTASPERFPIFGGLPVPAIARLATRANVISCNRGDVVLRQGAREDMVFVVLDGAVEVVRGGRALARLAAGGVFGEVAFLAGRRRTADVVAACDTRLLCLRASALMALVDDEPEVAAPFLLNLARVLAVRLAGGEASHPAAGPFT